MRYPPRKRRPYRSSCLPLALGLVLLAGLCALGLYFLPPVHERLAWRVEALRADIKYALNPPEQAVFVPQQASLDDLTPLPSSTPSPRPLPTTALPGPTGTATLAPTPTLTATPPPGQALLSGILHEYQMWNNCGPANLAMDLSYWGWKGDQRETAAFLKPNPRDKNVMPYEMVSFVQEQTNLQAMARVGGDLDLLKRFIAAGFPVIVEKGFEGVNFDGWMGHYEVVNGYDDSTRHVTVQDSYNGPDLSVDYDLLLSQWRAFNYLYILVYPGERGQEVLSILGPQADEQLNFQYAATKALQETKTLTGRDLYFAWYNRGTNLVNLKDFAGAAVAYDAAFANYPSIPEKQRPWRMLWYQTGPYFAYYYGQRYQDLIDLATTTLKASSEPILEESFYWRGRAELALGNNEAAIDDFRMSVKSHPEFSPGLELLQQLGAKP